jgi:hypothetical protein
VARPPKAIDAGQVEKLARLACTQAEIADFLNISVRTVQRRFAAVLARARAHVRMSLRRAMYLRATRDKSDKMLIHLGKVELGQGARAPAVLEELLRKLAD